ncbi:MAG: hypothetical protein M3542_12745 [Acidobacteriota bacterium]|nr:hypothetical protein [Acidobacteriota bacterium]MDQ5873300.1 hypothetical protein [Acidobacteriota bacterium]
MNVLRPSKGRPGVGWWAFAALAPGPALGVAAMLRLRSLSEGISDRAGANVTAPRP